MDEGIPNGGFDNLTQGPANLFGAALKINATNRLILRLHSQEVTVFLNGRQVAQAAANRIQFSGFVTFYVDNRGGKTIETIQLQRLLVFAAD